MGDVVDFAAARAKRQPEPWITKAEAAEHLRTTQRSVDRWRKERGLPYHKAYATGPVMFRRSELDAWIQGTAA